MSNLNEIDLKLSNFTFQVWQTQFSLKIHPLAIKSIQLSHIPRKLNFLLVACCSLVFACCSLVFACCSLVFARCSLVFARCWVVFGRCSLLFARCSLLFAHCSLVFPRCSLVFARCLLLFALCSLLWNKITVNRKKNSLTITKLRHRYFLAKILVTFSGW